MAKIFTEVELDKPRKMRFGYKVIKEIDEAARKGKKMTELESLEYMIFMSLKEDDAELKLSDIETILDDCDMDYIAEKLEETVQRDMPGLAKRAQEAKEASTGTEGKNS